jgi:hypothetical protein
MPYIGRTLGQGTRSRFLYTATAGQTTFSGSDSQSNTLAYSDNNGVDCFQNGVLLKGGGADYTATTGTSVVLTTGASVSDVIEILVYDVFAIADHVKKSGDAMTGALTNIDVNGSELVLDADGDTSITADTDDQIDFKTGGTDRVTIDSSGNLLVGKTSQGLGNSGVELREGSASGFTRNNTVMDLNRTGTSGQILRFRYDGTTEGSISVDGDILKIFATKSTANCGLGFFSNNTIRPVGNNGSEADDEVDLGHSSTRFDDIRATNGSIVTSDKNEKNTITDSDLGLDFVNRLSPKSYKFNNKTRTHYGLIAQDVETALGDVKKDATQFAGFCKDDISEKQDGSEYRYGLRYHEFISPMIQAIKDLKEEVDTLKAKVTALEGK